MPDVYHYDEETGEAINLFGSVPIDDTQPSEYTVYSSAKVESIVEGIEEEIEANCNSYIGDAMTVTIPSGTVTSVGYYSSPSFNNPSKTGYIWVGSLLKSGTGAAAPIAVAGSTSGKSIIQFYAYSALSQFNMTLYPVFKKQ